MAEVNNSVYKMDFPSEEILREGFETLSRTEGFEHLAKHQEPLAREYAVFNGFDRLSPETIAVLEKDECNFVRLAVKATKVEKQLLTLLANKAAAMLCPGKIKDPFTGEVFDNLPLIFLYFTNLSKNV